MNQCIWSTIEGPREGDGFVRRYCPECGKWTDWIDPNITYRRPCSHELGLIPVDAALAAMFENFKAIWRGLDTEVITELVFDQSTKHLTVTKLTLRELIPSELLPQIDQLLGGK